MNNINWAPDSWQQHNYQQSVSYPDKAALQAVLAELNGNPPLVSHLEINKLQDKLAKAVDGQYFILQGGDCAERFNDCHADNIKRKFTLLLQMGLILGFGLKKPILHIGRIAGQYAKPRSNLKELYQDQLLPIYRGDMINSDERNVAARRADPTRMQQAYACSAYTLNYLRALIDGGYTELPELQQWDLSALANSPKQASFLAMVDAISRSQCVLNKVSQTDNLQIPVEFYTSHECLHLPYEQALTHQVDGRWYLHSTHFPWVGMRSAFLDSAHCEFTRGLMNPIALKIGPQMEASVLQKIVRHLNPERISGRITLVHRLGIQHIHQRLPQLIAAMQECQQPVVWLCDPMHGNTIKTHNGLKTRLYSTILQELFAAWALHQAAGSSLNGIHIEATGEAVTECLGGVAGISEKDLSQAYQSAVDPRLNYAQALELAFSFTESIQANNLDKSLEQTLA